MERATDVRRHSNKHQDSDWMRWCEAFKDGVDERQAGQGPGIMEDGKMTWRYAAYISGYLFGTEPTDYRKDLFETAWEVWG